MRPRFFNPNHTHTPYVQLDTRKCKACWKCIDCCSNKVIDKIDIPWHKHVLIDMPEKCTGCLMCMKVCSSGALTKNLKHRQENKVRDPRIIWSFIVNLCLLITGFAMAFSGFVLQKNYHMGHHGQIAMSNIVWGLDYFNWSNFHKTTIVAVSLFMLFHVGLHWKWYKNVIGKNLIGKNKQVIILSAIFFLVAITGYIPWFIKITGGSGSIRKLFIEIHDKLALIFFIYLILHVIKRLGWFVKTIKNMKNQSS